MRDYTFKVLLSVSAQAHVTTRANVANVKPQRGGRRQNGLLLFVIG